MLKQVMKRAWAIAKAGVTKFGGKVREYFATALSIAWKEIKGMSKEMNNQIAVFTKKIGNEDVHFEILATEEGNLNAIVNGEKATRVSTKLVNVGCVYTIAGKVADMIYTIAGMPVKREVAIFHESAQTAEVSAEAYMNQFYLQKYNEMDPEQEIKFQFHSSHGVFTNAGKGEFFDKIKKNMDRFRRECEQFLEENGQVELGYDLSETKYVIKRGQMDSLLAFIDTKLAEAERVKADKKLAEQARINELIAKARETGEKQIAHQWTEECNCRGIDCSLDVVYVMVDGEGNQTEERTHTY